MRIRTKFCGITRQQDAEAAVEAGCDALGLVFHSASPRAVTADQAKAIIAGLPPFVSIVALFMNAEVAAVTTVCETLNPNCLQFHGEESAVFCEQFGCPYIKSLALGQENNKKLLPEVAEFSSAAALLVDGHAQGQMGGSGESFDWQGFSSQLSQLTQPVILAGGLKSDNVRQAIRLLKPYAVDVSSGIETQPGIKDPAKMAAFMQQVHSA